MVSLMIHYQKLKTANITAEHFKKSIFLRQAFDEKIPRANFSQISIRFTTIFFGIE